MSRLLRCYAEGQEGEWEAVCLDLDIAVQGSSFEAVVHLLNEAVCFHMETIMELPEAERAAFLHRPAPLSLRFLFFWYALKGLFAPSLGQGTKQCAEFTTACPA